MANETFASASGLRPASAFVVIGIVIFAVAVQIAWVSYHREAGQPERLREERLVDPEYAIADTNGQVLARFVPSLCLKLSPRSMWQAHTPELMAERISMVLDGFIEPVELQERFFPDADENGVIEAQLEITPRQAVRLREWILQEDSDAGPIEGLWIERVPDHSSGSVRWRERLFWRPNELLSMANREAHGRRSAWRWGRFLADGVIASLLEPEHVDLYEDERDQKEKDRCRATVWAGFCPSADRVVVRDIPPDKLVALRNELADQGVLPWQMRIAYDRKRVYPAGHHRLLGSWGYLDDEATERAPRAGLERLCDELLREKRWPLPEPRSEKYVWRKDRTVRGERANGYVSYEPASIPPTIQTTLDLSLQVFVRQALEELMATHRPAIAMALVCDVQTGDVLAVEAVNAYDMQPFAPLFHQFTVGSTFKVVTMAVALEEGVVDPTEEIDVGQGAFRILGPEGRPTRRIIREARGAPTGVIRAEDCVARSSNAGMSQIGLRVEDSVFHDYMTSLGYGRLPGSGLGSERGGMIPRLPWKYQYAHASVGFGHEIASTLWQHATSLASILRGGGYRPLRLIRGLQLEDQTFECGLPPSEPIFGPNTAGEVRAMMRLGAIEGTGEDARVAFEKQLTAWVGRDIEGLEYEFGSKTGTAEKVRTEICLHVELGERRRWREEGLKATRSRLEELPRLEKPHRSCYTSSICVFGSRPWDDRELMVLVVADEPLGEAHFGSQVAGPTASKVLSEALGLTKCGDAPSTPGAIGFGTSALPFRNSEDHPWVIHPPTEGEAALLEKRESS